MVAIEHIVIVLFGLSTSVLSQNYSDMKRLYRNLTNDYDNKLFPVRNYSEPFSLYFLSVPLVMNSFVESEETVSFGMGMYFLWNDPNLTWDPSLYGNFEYITVATGDIWLPFVFLENSADSLQRFGYDSEFYVQINHNGIIEWTTGSIIKAKCPTNILKFPFDDQTCDFVFTMWGTRQIGINYIPFNPHALMDYYTKSSSWEIKNTEQFQRRKIDIQEFVLRMSLKRRPLYYIVVIILPTFLFCVMNPLVFLLPVESGERVSLGMTILLSYAIFLTIVTGSLPASSYPMCLLLLIMIIIMMISGLIVISSVISVHIWHKTEVSLCLRRSCKRTFKTGKDVSRTLDIVFMLLSYVLFSVVAVGYVLYIRLF